LKIIQIYYRYVFEKISLDISFMNRPADIAVLADECNNAISIRETLDHLLHQRRVYEKTKGPVCYTGPFVFFFVCRFML
jgi:hypothetical protein